MGQHRVDRLARLLADLEQELGPPDEAVVVEVLASLDRLEKRQSRPERYAGPR
jgi:hypothetical protein